MTKIDIIMVSVLQCLPFLETLVIFKLLLSNGDISCPHFISFFRYIVYIFRCGTLYKRVLMPTNKPCPGKRTNTHTSAGGHPHMHG